MIAIDLGSNTIRVLQYDCKTKKSLYGYQKVVKTADNLASTGFIDDKAVKRVIDAINEAKQNIDFSLDDVMAVTTEAIRRASNNKEVLAKIKLQTGVSFTIISGEEEARLTLLAVSNRLQKLNYAFMDFVVVDIGGGSTEITFNLKDKVISKSFSIGIVTMAQSYDNLEAIKQNIPKEMREIKMFCDEIYQNIKKPKNFIATAGTPTTVASMKQGMVYNTYDASKINGTLLQKSDLDFYLNKLLSFSSKQREIAVGTGREDLVTAGIIIYKELFTILGFEECIVVDDGLREGVVLDGCEKNNQSK